MKRILFYLGIISFALGAANALVAKIAATAPVPMWVGLLVGGLGATVVAAVKFVQMGGPPTIPPLTPGAGVAIFLLGALLGQLSGCKTGGGVDGGVTGGYFQFEDADGNVQQVFADDAGKDALAAKLANTNSRPARRNE